MRVGVGMWGCGADAEGADSGSDAPPPFSSFPTQGADASGTTHNVPPTAPVVHIDPMDPVASDDLHLVFDDGGGDPDDGPGPLSYLIAWYQDGAQRSEVGEDIAAADTARGEIWRVEVRSYDGFEASVIAEDEVLIANAAPLILSANVEPENPVEDSVLTCVVGEAVDPDGDAVSHSYQWFIGGDVIAGETQSALAPPLQPGKAYRCYVIPFDGIGL